MNSNFQFLASEFKDFYQRTVMAEKNVITDPRTSLVYCRMALELAIHWMYKNDEELSYPYNKSLDALMKEYCFEQQLRPQLYNDLFVIKKLGNYASHNNRINDDDAYRAIEVLFIFSRWFVKCYAKENIDEIPKFDYELIPMEGEAALTKRQLKNLATKNEREVQSYIEKLEEQQQEKEQLFAENELFKKQIAELQAQIAENKKTAHVGEEKYRTRSEADTRKFIIDLNLRDAGWNIEAANVKEYEVNNMPKSTNPSGKGYIDYVLWDDDGLPLAVVEAKKAMSEATLGENQAQLYAECLEKKFGRKPLMYYTNGYDIYLWDDQFYKSARKVHGFYTKAEMQTQMFRRLNRKDIRKAAIDTDIAGRDYQMRSIKSIAEHFAGTDKKTGKLIGTNRGALLVLATGTGKTRTSIAFSKMMLASNWVKRILFLADRTSLVSQAKRNFVSHLPDYSCVNLLEDKDNPDARIAFSTYQTMMGMIDNPEKEIYYGVGQFDLIIIDEAHRSIYKKYRAIFEYFDALFLGLTATPIGRIDKNTYDVFGLPDKSPTDAYTFDEAVADKFLSPYHSINVSTNFLKRGIKYSELSAEEQKEFDDEILAGEEGTGNEIIPSSDLNSWLFNKDTAIKTLRYVLDHGIKKQGGEELGKTIFFAKNQKHAQFIKETFLEMDKELFGNDYVKVITHSEPKSEEMIKRFCNEEKEQLPQIAISVDMMDTGIDAPSCVNLVFYKPVKSYAKFWQMIGRGSRLRPNLFGEGKNKTHFLIFDLCDNFGFFEENPNGIEAKAQRSLTELLFGLRLRLAEYLKSNQFLENESFQSYRTELLDELHHEIACLDRERFDVKMKLEMVDKYGIDQREIWNHLTKRDTKIIEENLASLVKPKEGDHIMARYYDKLLYTIILNRLETPNNNKFVGSSVDSIKKVANTSKKILKKLNIEEVRDSEELLRSVLKDDFWKRDGIVHLEKLRIGVRELVKYIEKENLGIITTDFDDEIEGGEVTKHSANIINDDNDSVEYQIFKNNKMRLEELVRENENHIVVSKIKNGQRVTKDELNAFENLLLENGVNLEAVSKEVEEEFVLVPFISGLVGLSKEAVDKAFANFINEYELDSKQIYFMEMLKKFLTTNGKIEPEKLFYAPFNKHHSLGVEGVFTEKQADIIFEIIDHFNQKEVG